MLENSGQEKQTRHHEIKRQNSSTQCNMHNSKPVHAGHSCVLHALGQHLGLSPASKILLQAPETNHKQRKRRQTNTDTQANVLKSSEDKRGWASMSTHGIALIWGIIELFKKQMISSKVTACQNEIHWQTSPFPTLSELPLIVNQTNKQSMPFQARRSQHRCPKQYSRQCSEACLAHPTSPHQDKLEQSKWQRIM